MVFHRPLIYFSVPGLALFIGFCWLHRDKFMKRDTKYKKSIKNEDDENTTCNKALNYSISIPMNEKSSNGYKIVEEKFGKSAPINIVQNGKSLIYSESKNLDSSKINTNSHNSEISDTINKDLECSFLSVDLPSTMDNKVKYPARRIRVASPAEPFVIKATNNPKISPEDSFLESKYTQEENNKLESYDVFEDLENVEVLLTSHENYTAVRSLTSAYSSHSNDSGKDSSVAHSDTTAKLYEFLIPANLVPKLCGKKNMYLEQIRSKSKANVIVKKYNNSNKAKICSIEGTENEINSALSLIRDRLPKLTANRVNFDIPQEMAELQCIDNQIRLVEGVNNDVIVSAIDSNGHIFLQHPLHPSYPSFSILQNNLNEYYEKEDAPVLPEIIENAICVGRIGAEWYRLQIVSRQLEEDACLVKLLDFGGNVSICTKDLRQIRTDFILIPFQATECVLSNIVPLDEKFSLRASEILMRFAKGIILQAQITGYNFDNFAEVYVFAQFASNCVIFINKELVARNLAKWIECLE